MTDALKCIMCKCVLNGQGYFFGTFSDCSAFSIVVAIVIIVDVYVLHHVSVTNRFWASKYAGQRCKMLERKTRAHMNSHTKHKLCIEFKRPAYEVFIIFKILNRMHGKCFSKLQKANEERERWHNRTFLGMMNTMSKRNERTNNE